MDIYLSGSISGGRQKIQTYIRIKEIIESLGHKINSPQTVDPNVTDSGEGSIMESRKIYERDMGQIHECNLMIAEITIPSLGVGYEIASAIHLDKPVLCLYDMDNPPRRISAMIAGNTSYLVTLKGYRESTLESILKHELNAYQLFHFDDI